MCYSAADFKWAAAAYKADVTQGSCNLATRCTTKPQNTMLSSHAPHCEHLFLCVNISYCQNSRNTSCASQRLLQFVQVLYVLVPPDLQSTAYGWCQHVILSQQSTVGCCATACRQNGKVTGYVRIVVFSQNAAADVQHAVQELISQVMCLL